MISLALPEVVRSGLRSQLERELHALFARSDATTHAYGADFSRLWSLAARHVQGGKLLRPMLLLETYGAVRASQKAARSPHHADGLSRMGAQDHSEAVRIAAAVEALHYAFLLHDDVIDGDYFRRGQPNLIGELADTSLREARPGGAMHWAQAGGILMGNLLLCAAHQLFARVEIAAELKLRLLDLLEHTIFETTAGEFSDVGLSDGIISPDLSTVLAMTSRKTASYSFELPLRAAAILADGSSDLESRLSVAGSHLGLAYQLQDDLLSTFGDAAVHGKDPYSDLREGKQTAIICFARTSDIWPHLEADFGNPSLSPKRAEYLSARLRDIGAEDFVLGIIDEQMTAFSAVIAGGEKTGAIPEEVQGILLAFAERIKGRQS